MNEEPIEDNSVPTKNKSIKRLGSFVWKKISLATILTAIGLIATFCYFDYSKKIQYTDRQMRDNPELKIVKTELVTAHFKSDTFDTKNPSIDSSGVIVLNGKVDIKFRFFITNVGKSRADIVGKMFLDTTSGDLIIRRDIENKSRNFVYQKLPDPYYPDQEIEAGDTIKDWHTFPIQFMVLLLIGVFGSFLELRQLNYNFTQLDLHNKTAVQTGIKHNQNINKMTNPLAVQQVNIINPTIAEEYRNESGNAVPVDAIPVVIVGDRR